MNKIIYSILITCCSIVYANENPYPNRFEGIFEEYDGHRLDLIAKFIPENPVILEAGCHYGYDTIHFIEKWPDSKIYSFEPNPHSFGIFLENTRNYPNVTAFPIALSNFNGFGLFYICYGSNGDNPVFEGASSLLEPSEEMKIHYQGPRILVPCHILDDLCKTINLDHIDFMWLDMEGMELQVLSSSPNILKTVKVIYTETNFIKFRIGMTQYGDLKSYLESQGFVLLSHWYAQGFQGNAIFLKKELYPL